MLQNWETIWNKREISKSNNYTTLETLIMCDGFDTPLGIMKEMDWRNYIQIIQDKLKI